MSESYREVELNDNGLTEIGPTSPWVLETVTGCTDITYGRLLRDTSMFSSFSSLDLNLALIYNFEFKLLRNKALSLFCYF